MDSEKLDNQLKLALDSTNRQRQKTSDLEIGYDEEESTWELIIKYIGDIERIQEELDMQLTVLFAGYAVIIIKQRLISRLSEYDEIEFIEMPKKLQFAVNDGRAASCINPVQRTETGLFGEGVIVAIIDSGIDYSHPDFRNPDNTTRIIAIWDQTIAPSGDLAPPEGFSTGTLYTRERINMALRKRTVPEQLELVPSTDLSGHGTHVA
ncbi:S8 family serine peptidase [Anaeromicropila populeti]|uniref:Subtilase family protein n=1 Tax=Anaeromicropila populeti TaxID=37658 RepID=A0A1I6HIX6_9FIRM|nr:S8 family serine peptidase [Anaeromicropila populeti]SFR54419.1 Subtilase family protein [Anaeromicropila populeti]